MDSAWTWSAERVARHVAERLGVRPVGTARRLTGGLLNVVWRVPVVGPNGEASVIVKCVPPFAASAPNVPLSPSRMVAEARALNALGPAGMPAGVATDRVRVPRLLDVDAARSVLVMEDAGALPDLGTWMDSVGSVQRIHHASLQRRPERSPSAALRAGSAKSRDLDASPQRVEIPRQARDEVGPERLHETGVAAVLDAGRALGGFVGRLHAATLDRPDLAAFANPDVQATRLAVQYRAVGGWLAETGVADADALGAVAVAMGERFSRPGRCVVMGDLWPPSVLVGPDGLLTVIDWELSTLGEPAQDLGHLAAHLWLRDRLDVWDAFVGGYREAAGPALLRLLAGGTADDAARHAACEVLARTAGTFLDSTFDGGEAIARATHWLRDPVCAAPFAELCVTS